MHRAPRRRPNLFRERLGVLTSGGDAPGMNACLRAIVRSGIYQGFQVIGVQNGYEGLIEGRFVPLMLRSVGNIIQRGGTILGSSRSEEFRTKAGRKAAYENLKAARISKLICLGGDGTLQGAKILSEEYPVRVMGIPVTIDNDILGTDLAIGFDSAVNTAVQCIDKIRDTADSHGRVFVIEVMGRNTGHLALEVALAAGAEYVVLPEVQFRPKSLVSKIKKGIDRGKMGSIVIVAERGQPGFVFEVAKTISRAIKRDVRSLVLGHLQRGGSPTSTDRNIAAMMGAEAVSRLLAGKNREMVGVVGRRAAATPLRNVIGKNRPVEVSRRELIERLSI